MTIRSLFLAMALVSTTVARAAVTVPTIEGPIASPEGAFVQATSFPLASVGYVKEEYFISGTASAFTNVGPLGDDGMWTVAPASTAPYKTRILVFRPAKPKKFNGTVVVEWLNVSGGLDTGPDWLQAHVELIRDGFAWMGVSAQFVGVEGGPGLVNVVSLPLKQVNPTRYGSLSHPGDSFSYDMFSQAGATVRDPSGPFKSLKVKKVIAAGESQSAFRMVNYVNAIHPITKLFDGYLIHSRGGFGAALSEAPQPVVPAPGGTKIRLDLGVPVLTFETETDLTFLAYFGVRQDDSKNFRLWEVAGTSHADIYTVATGAADLGTSPSAAAPVENSSPLPGFIDCNQPLNSGPQHYVLNAAFAALNKWVRKGKAPKSAPRLDVAAGPPVAIVRDANGNARGGIRTPMVDAPIAAFTGEQDGSILCRLFGTTDLFDAAQLSALYPSHKAFTSAWNKSLKKAVKEGWILKPDAKLIKQWAASAAVPS